MRRFLRSVDPFRNTSVPCRYGWQQGAGLTVNRQEPDRPGAPGGPVELAGWHLERDGEPAAPVRTRYPTAALPPGDLVPRDRRIPGNIRELPGERRLGHPATGARTPDQIADRFLQDRLQDRILLSSREGSTPHRAS